MSAAPEAVSAPPAHCVMQAHMGNTAMTVAVMRDDDFLELTHVCIGGAWYWATDVLSESACDALQADVCAPCADDFDPRSEYDADRAADERQIRYERELDARASQ